VAIKGIRVGTVDVNSRQRTAWELKPSARATFDTGSSFLIMPEVIYH
jgi:hypothetical protein